jgi:hypothetical protein
VRLRGREERADISEYSGCREHDGCSQRAGNQADAILQGENDRIIMDETAMRQ